MWERYEIKMQAKSILKKCYWPAFVVSLVLAIVSGGSGSSGRSTFEWNSSSSLDLSWLPLIILAGLVVIAVGLIIRIFIGFALEVGGRRFFIEALKGNVQVSYLTSTFKSNGFKNIVKVMFIRGVIIIAWTFLLIIPGIIKSYAYRMVPYILAENPNIDGKEALELSDRMTKGEKFNIFLLDLSFIGWFILGGLACGVGVMFVMPYYDMTQAVLYDELKTILREDGELMSLKEDPYDDYE